ncbi:MAG: NfeD family protein [Planctomycetota bacterium]|nr:hypothetical protein [Planctomycetota bacterium]MCX8039298.1 hypothetical protein [Planctomycetota bacterium]MDW8372063.1 NfeD family protein [Planctomycetota bacterium]
MLHWLLGLLLVAVAPFGQGGEATPAGGQGAGGKPLVAFIPIDGAIDDHRAGQFERAVDRALALSPRYIVCRIATDGGALDAAMRMLERILAVGDEDTELIAFIDTRAYSAGALLAYGHRRIYMTDQAYIGDIGVIFVSQDPAEPIKYAPEKLESPVRALLRQAGQHNGWDQAKLQKMTARNQELWRFDIDGRQHFVIEDDLPAFLAARPGLRKEDGVLILGKDRLLTYTAKEAVAEGMATALVKDLDEVYRLLGVEPSAVQRFLPSRHELIAETLGGWAPLLAGLALLLLLLEFKMPSGGLFLIGAAVCGLLFLVCQYWLDLVGAAEIILIAFGILALITEFFLFPTGGLLLIAGLLAIGGGMIFAFMPDSFQFEIGDERWRGAMGHALIQSLLALTVLTIGAIVAIAALPRTRAMRVLASEAAIDATTAGDLEQQARALIGKRVRTRTMLRPSGFVIIDGRDVPAVAEHGVLVPADSEVEIVGAQLGELVVRPVEAEARA